MSNRPADYGIAKLDFSNAFNNLSRDAMLSAAAEIVQNTHRHLQTLSYRL